MATAVSSKSQPALFPEEGQAVSAPAAMANERLDHPSRLLAREPYFASRFGAAYLGDSLELLQRLPTGCLNLVDRKSVV